MSKKTDLLRSLVIIMITSVVMFTITFTVYGMIARPEFYTQFMKLGTKYLSEGKYEEAILQFEKAIEIEEKSTQARVGIAKGSIELGDVKTAVKVLKEAQKIAFDDKKLLKEMIDIIKYDDPDAAYEMLMEYVNKYGEDKLSDELKVLYDSSKEKPQIPDIIPPSGTYIRPFSVRIKTDKARLGHSYYYTKNGDDPDKKDTWYREPFEVKDDVLIKFRGYNPEGEYTEVFQVEYVIDTAFDSEIEELISTIEKKLMETEEGREVGNCVEGAKEELKSVLDENKEAFNKEFVTTYTAQRIYDALYNALVVFESKIIVPTDREALESAIEEAEQLIEKAVEGDKEGQYRSGAKSALAAELQTAKEVEEDLLARQDAIDQAADRLKRAIESFEAKKLTEIDVIIEETGAKVGPVTVSLLWHTEDDIDLHVTSPMGETINYMNRTGRSGGSLDVDRQVDVFVANPVENIYWQNPPSGTYTVKVNMFSKRTSGNVPITVRVIMNGESKVYNTSINSGTITICSFEY